MVGLAGFDYVWFMGPHSADFEAGLKKSGFQKNYVVSNSYEQTLALRVMSMLNPHDIVIVKGSRGMKLERVVADWNPVNFTSK